MTIKITCEGLEQTVKESAKVGETRFSVDKSLICGSIAHVLINYPTPGEQCGIVQVAAQLRSCGIRDLLLYVPYLPYSADPEDVHLTRGFMDLLYGVGARTISTWHLPRNQPSLSRRLTLEPFEDLLQVMLAKHPSLAVGDLTVVASSAADIENAEAVADALNANLAVNLGERGLLRREETMHELWFKGVNSEVSDESIPGWAKLLSIHSRTPNFKPVDHFSFTSATQPSELFVKVM